jgi:hypothetical protein
MGNPFLAPGKYAKHMRCANHSSSNGTCRASGIR